MEYQLPPIRTTIIMKQMIPYLFYLVLFNFYAIYYFERRMNVDITNSWSESIQYFGSQLILLIFTFYFLYSAVKQLGGNLSFTQLITNAWFILDIIPSLLVSTSITITWINETEKSLMWQRYLNSIALFILWVKSLAWLRVHRSFSALISMLIRVTAGL